MTPKHLIKGEQGKSRKQCLLYIVLNPTPYSVFFLVQGLIPGGALVSGARDQIGVGHMQGL